MAHALRRALLPALCLPCALLAPARADDWTAALRAQHEAEDLGLAERLYAKVRRGPHARAALVRRIEALLELGRGDEARAQLERLRTYPGDTGAVERWLEDPPKPLALARRGRAQVERQLERVVSLNLDGTPFSEALAFVADLSEVSFVALPGAGDEAVRLQVQGRPLGEALSALLGPGRERRVLPKLVLVGKKPLPALPDLPEAALAGAPDTYRRLCESEVSCAFDGAPLGEAVAFLRDAGLLNLVVRRDCRAAKVKLKVKAARLIDVVRLLALLGGAQWTLVGDAVLLGRSLPATDAARRPGAALEAPEVARELDGRVVHSLNFADTPLEEVCAFLREMTGLEVRLGPGVDGAAELSLRLRDVRLRDALRLIASVAGLVLRVEGSAITLERSPAGERKEKAPEAPPRDR